MAPYYFMLILPIFSSLPYVITKKINNKVIILWTFFIALIVLLALRSESVGADLPVYQYYFNVIAMSDWCEILNPFYIRDIEWGYVVLNKAVSSVYYNFHFFLMVVALLTVLPIAALYVSKSSLPFLTIALFINMPTFVMLFSGLRQSIAIAVGAIAFHYVQNRQLFKFAICVFIAFMFHFSALVLLIMFPIYHIKITQKHLPAILALFMGIVIFADEIFLFVMQFMGPRYASRYANIEKTGDYAMLLLFFIFTLFTFIFAHANKLNNELLGLRNFLLINLFIQAFSPISTIAMRLGYYYLIFIPLLIPLVIEHGKVKYKSLLRMAHMVMVMFFFIYYFVNAHYGADILHVYPYDMFI